MRERNLLGQFVVGHESIGGFTKGSKHTELAKMKISESLIGKFAANSRRWKAESASYEAKHMWVLKHYGKAKKCEQIKCGYKNPSRYEWHNLSGLYNRERFDYVQLCPSCHRKIHKGSLQLCVL